nr:hypothetical protein [Pseudomonas luteola]
MAVTSAQVQELYVGYLGRAADQAGLDYWLSELNAENPTLTLENLRANFVNEQPEYANAYAGLDRAQTVAQIYNNLFGRDATDAEISYWTYDSNVNTDQLITAFTNAASASDRLVLANSVNVAQLFTTAYAGSTLESADLVTALGGISDYAITSSVDASGNTVYTFAGAPATYTSANAAAQAALADAQSTFTGTDTLAPNFYGTEGSITLTSAFAGGDIVLANQAGADVQTINVSGEYEGTVSLTTTPADEPTAGTDITTLNLSLTGDANTVSLATLTNLQTINASASTSDLTLDTAGLVELTSLVAGSGDDKLTVTTTTSNTANLTVDAGAGNDTVTLSATNGTTAEAVHTVAVTLGAGNDTLDVDVLANVQNLGTTTAAQNAALTASAVTVTDFNGSADVLDVSALGAYSALNNTAVGAVSSAATLAEAITAAAAGSTGVTSFVYGDNTYVYADAGNDGLNAGDGLIELVGFTGALTAANFVGGTAA